MIRALTVVFVLLNAVPCAAQIVVRQATGLQVANAADSLTITLTGVVSGNAILVPVFGDVSNAGGFGGTDTSDAGGTYTMFGSVTSGSNNTALYRFMSAAAGTHTIVINPASSGHYISGVALEVSGLAASPDDSWNFNGAFGSAPTVTVSPATTNNNDLCIGVLSHNGPGALLTVESTSPAWIEAGENLGGGTGGEIDYKIVSSAGLWAANWTSADANNWAATIQCLKGAAAAAGARSGGLTLLGVGR